MHRAKGDRLVRTGELPVYDNGNKAVISEILLVHATTSNIDDLNYGCISSSCNDYTLQGNTIHY